MTSTRSLGPTALALLLTFSALPVAAAAQDATEAETNELWEEPEPQPETEPQPEAEPPPEPEPEPQAEPEPAPEKPKLSDEPETPPGPPRWENHVEMGKMMGYGSIGVCEAVTLPLSLIPSIGTAIGFVFEIACLYPGALTIDYISLFHGDTDSALWQAATAVILAKLWRVGTRFAAVGVIAAAGAATLAAGAVLLGGASVSALLTGGDVLAASTPLVWVPTMLGTVMALAGFTYIVLRKVRKAGQGLIYEWTYEALADRFETPAAQKEAQDAAYVYPPLSWWERAWVLMAMADGSDPEFRWVHAIPVVGRVIKAGDAAEALKGHMRKVGEDMAGEEPEDLTAMDNTIDTLAAFEGGLGALAEAALIMGGVASSVGLALTASYFLLESNLLIYGLATTGIGMTAMVAGGAGLTFLLLREVPRFFRPFAVPLAYGPVPYAWLDEEEGEGEAALDDGEE